MTREEREEAGTAGILRAWQKAPDGMHPTAFACGRIVRGLTLLLEAEGLIHEGKLSANGTALLRRVSRRAKKAGAS